MPELSRPGASQPALVTRLHTAYSRPKTLKEADVDLMEYQAKELFARHGVPVTLGRVIEDPAEAAEAAAELGGRVVVKAQVKTGGRGKAGGVKLAATPEEAVAKAGEILGMDIKGHTVHRVLLAPAADIADEYYFSFVVDRANREYLCIAST